MRYVIYDGATNRRCSDKQWRTFAACKRAANWLNICEGCERYAVAQVWYID